MFVLHWKYRPWRMSHFVRYWYCFHVYLVLAQTNLRICAVLQEHLLLAHMYLPHVHIHVPILTWRCNYPVGFNSKFWCINVVCACIEGACGNARMVKLIWVFTGYTSVTHLHKNIKYLLHEWPKKAHVILTSCAVSPERLTARRLIALNAHASTPSLTLCMLGNFSCFSWRLLTFFSKLTFLVGPDLGPNCLHRLSADNIRRC